MTDHIAVLGGGVAGVVAANELAREGATVDLIERAPRLGGLHRSVTVDGMVFDIGAFVFSERHEMIRSFPFLRGVFPSVRPTLVSITPKGSLDRYPISLRGYVADHGISGLCAAAADLLTAKVRHRRRDTVPTFAKYYMGESIYRRSGLQHYIERLYGLPDDEVGIEFATQRLCAIKLFTPGRIAGRCVRKGWNRLRGTLPPESRAMVRPAGGFDEAYRLIHDHLEHRGVTVHLDCQVRSIRPANHGFDVDFGDRVTAYDRVISTIPIPVAQRLVGLTPGMMFDSMSLYSLFYNGRLRHDAACQNNFTWEGRWKRLTAFSKYYGRHCGDDYWTVEVTTKDTSPKSLDALRQDFEDHAAKLGLTDGAPAFLGGHITERAYPVFHRGDSARIEAERNRLTDCGIDIVGRQGAFEYLSSHSAATKAKELAAAIGGTAIRPGAQTLSAARR